METPTAPRGDGGDVQALIDALSSPIRREILWLIWDAELPAGEIAAAFALTPGTISSHLSVLRDAGFVAMRRDGTFRRYRADRAAIERILPFLRWSDDKWRVADDIPEQELAHSRTQLWLTVHADVAFDEATAFAAFVDGPTFSSWLGVPVSIEDRRFSAELEWGTKVRGRYEVVVPPELIALRWDFDDDAVPVPGRALPGYVRFEPAPPGCRVEVHQAAQDAEQAEFLAVAWSLVLGRLVEYARAEEAAPSPRARRPKHLDSG
ncbi:metalloregulator ArsR/SmtB family transcription factor [Agromyces sp. NPDC058484]|uniref:metalloregulator ArsR/SmtB family transcription factor n=1 Tax=Agromyces sp. NPDC058484 TaxID=3346524 RepID=UPI003665D4BB